MHEQAAGRDSIRLAVTLGALGFSPWPATAGGSNRGGAARGRLPAGLALAGNLTPGRVRASVAGGDLDDLDDDEGCCEQEVAA